MNKILFSFLAASILLYSSCQPQAPKQLTSASMSMIEIDSTFDTSIDKELAQELALYKSQLDSTMNRVLAQADMDMRNGKPQSLLANFTADALVKAGKKHTGKPVVLGLMNNGGLRAPISKGQVTVGDIFKVFPFENELVILELTGKDLKILFNRLAAIGGEGLSGCELVIRNNQVESLLVDNKPIEDDQTYWIATIDYLAEGNSGMSILLEAKQSIKPGILLRDVMLDTVEELTAQGKTLQAKLDSRISVNP